MSTPPGEGALSLLSALLGLARSGRKHISVVAGGMAILVRSQARGSLRMSLLREA